MVQYLNHCLIDTYLMLFCDTHRKNKINKSTMVRFYISFPSRDMQTPLWYVKVLQEIRSAYYILY